MTKPWLVDRGQKVSFSSPNINELRALCTYLGLGDIPSTLDDLENKPDCQKQILSTAAPLLENLTALMITMGRSGFMILRKSSSERIDEPLLTKQDISERNQVIKSSDDVGVLGMYFRANANVPVASVSGAGDCLAAGFICGMLQGKTVSECSALGLHSARQSLMAAPAVPETLTPEILPWGSKSPFSLIRI